MPTGNIELAQDDLDLDPEYFERYIDHASGRRGDTRQDRIISVYVAMRTAAKSEAWHRVPGLRAFTQRYAEYNPYIPPEIRESWLTTRHEPGNSSAFLDEWKAADRPWVEHLIDPKALLETIESDREIADRFVQHNLHSADYFYTKYTEWHLSSDYIREHRPARAVDLGAAYQGFARVATRLDDNVEVEMVDLGFPSGRSDFAPRIHKVGSDAGRLSDYFPDGSVDFVCSHNAFEHFNGDGDTRSIREIARILSPGGVALITPFFTAGRHTVSINPFASYVANESMDLAVSVELELAEEPDSRISFNHQMISPYARAYSYASAQRRLMAGTSGIGFRLLVLDFDDDAFKQLSGRSYGGVPMGRDIYRDPSFLALEITRQ